MLEQVTVSSPARLHFGLLSVGQSKDISFGGVGMMIDQPRTIVTASKAQTLKISGEEQEIVREIVNACLPALQNDPNFASREHPVEKDHELPVHLTVQQVLPRHSGFGSGTQLALSVATAIFVFFESQMPSTEELAAIVNRGKRSAIGSHGFFQGGFLVDRGKQATGTLSPLDFRADFPEPWRILTIQLQDSEGLSGPGEKQAFEQLAQKGDRSNPEFPQSDCELPFDREAMANIIREKMIPGLLNGNYELFGEGVYEFGFRSGLMFKDIQGGPYNGKTIETLISRIQTLGVKAVGQSSWGPCVFAIASHDEQAKQLADELKREYGDRASIEIAKADNRGVQITTKQT